MVYTPFHYPVAYLIHKVSGKKLHMPSLVMASFTPDLEPLVLKLIGYPIDRLVLHSIFGALTVGSVLTVALLAVCRKIFKRALPRAKWPDASLKTRLLSMCLGLAGHVLLDSLHHPFNPLFYPFVYNFGGFVLFGSPAVATTLMEAIFVPLTVFILLTGYAKSRDMGRFVSEYFMGHAIGRGGIVLRKP